MTTKPATPAADLPEFPGFCFRNYYTVAPAAYIERIRDEIHLICPPADLARLRELATLEEALAETAEKFGEADARQEHEAAASALRANPSPENVRALKKLGALDVILAHYGAERRKLEAAALDVRRSALPIIESATRRLVGRLVELADCAAAEEAALYESWGIQPPAESAIRLHVGRAIQEIAQNYRREAAPEVPTGVGVRGFLRMLGVE